MEKHVPQAFMSYAHFDNDYLGGAITRLKTELEDSYRAANGSRLNVFIDSDGIAWGKQWRERLDSALAASLFLIPIVTSSFVSSSECCREFADFLELERRLGRNDLILPLLFLRTWQLEDEELKRSDMVVRELCNRQWKDWTQYAESDLKDRRTRLFELGIELGKAVRSYSVLSVVGKMEPEVPAHEEAADSALDEEVRRALRAIGVASADGEAQRIVAEAAKLAPEPAFEEKISLSRVFCGALVVGVRSEADPSSRMVSGLVKAVRTPRWEGTMDKNLARFRYDTIDDAIRRLRLGFSRNTEAALKSALDRAETKLTGDAVVEALLKPASHYRGSLLYAWIPDIEELSNDVTNLAK
jgi:TIR domain-containing protein